MWRSELFKSGEDRGAKKKRGGKVLGTGRILVREKKPAEWPFEGNVQGGEAGEGEDPNGWPG